MRKIEALKEACSQAQFQKKDFTVISMMSSHKGREFRDYMHIAREMFEMFQTPHEWTLEMTITKNGDITTTEAQTKGY